MIRALPSSEYPSMVGENFQIYIVQITGKCFHKTPHRPWHDLIIRLPYRTTPHKFAKKGLSPHEKLFWIKFPPYLREGDTLLS